LSNQNTSSTPEWAANLANRLLAEASMDKPFWRVMADAIAGERERCAMIAEARKDLYRQDGKMACVEIASSIRTDS
jgi:hypothetical protein